MSLWHLEREKDGSEAEVCQFAAAENLAAQHGDRRERHTLTM